MGLWAKQCVEELRRLDALDEGLLDDVALFMLESEGSDLSEYPEQQNEDLAIAFDNELLVDNLDEASPVQVEYQFEEVGLDGFVPIYKKLLTREEIVGEEVDEAGENAQMVEPLQSVGVIERLFVNSLDLSHHNRRVRHIRRDLRM